MKEKYFSISKKLGFTIIFIALSLFLIPASTKAQCTATSIQVCGVADDEMTLYIEGIQVGVGGDFRFAHVQCPTTQCAPGSCSNGGSWGVCMPVCMPVTDVNILNAITANNSNVVVAARVMDAGPQQVFGSWYIDIGCANNDHAYIQSDGTNTQVIMETEAGTFPTCSTVAPPYSGGADWYDPVASPTGWSPALQVTGTIWSKQMFDPQTGAIIPVLSNSVGGTSQGACHDLYFRQSVSIQPIPPPPATAITITKQYSDGSNSVTFSEPATGNEAATVVIQVCNSGVGITGAVTLLDTGSTTGIPFWGSENFRGPQNITGSDGTNTGKGSLGQPGWHFDWGDNAVVVAGQSGDNAEEPITLVNGSGFPGASWNGTSWVPYCWSVTMVGQDNTAGNEQFDCGVHNNFATWLGSGNPQSNGITYVWSCNTPTWTPTFTNTFTWTQSFTPTPSPTKTLTPTPTSTFTNTYTLTPSWTQTPVFSFTFTNTPTITFTPTNTLSPTQTFTPTLSPTATFSPTITNTPTITFTPTITDTPTITFTPTATVPFRDNFYINQNLFQPSQGPVSITVDYSAYPGPYSLRIYNTAGEFIRDLSKEANNPPYLSSTLPTQYYQWDGKNYASHPCASGVYIFYLIEPFDRKIKKLLLVH